jgi:hypothetical protein
MKLGELNFLPLCSFYRFFTINNHIGNELTTLTLELYSPIHNPHGVTCLNDNTEGEGMDITRV